MKFINDFIMDELIIEKDPFPHVVLDNFLKKEYLDIFLKEMDELTIDKSYYYGDQTFEKNKFAFKDNFKENLNLLFAELNSSDFIKKLENNFKIPFIIQDNLNLQGAGIHKVFNDGFLCMHTDFETYFDNKLNLLLDRRLNFLLYMNPNWKKEYGGELFLYDKNKEIVTKKIVPILNRCIIFETPNNIHGHPNKLSIPESLCRQSITNYYYTPNSTGKNLQGEECKSVVWFSNLH